MIDLLLYPYHYFHAIATFKSSSIGAITTNISRVSAMSVSVCIHFNNHLFWHRFLPAAMPSQIVEKSVSSNLLIMYLLSVINSSVLSVILLDIEVYEATGTVYADTGASQSVGGELMVKFLKNRGQKFTELYLSMHLADGQQSTPLVQKATVPITVCGRTFQTHLKTDDFFLPHAKGNWTLLGVDFLKTSGIVMNMRKKYCDVPVQSNPADESETSDLHLSEERQNFDAEERNDLTVLLNENKDVFNSNGVSNNGVL
ncbi:transposon Tf2-6 polyprotein [Nephila pilipes]|uniref:Transposon Tf2-6 polyprotein n=1 Tax=Nephila pilipes TaxID=299642 RepID=A0A8X6N5R1_NEPPI|nr:transposon Tf2-6 polyprotein [Nephila pilipes]